MKRFVKWFALGLLLVPIHAWAQAVHAPLYKIVGWWAIHLDLNVKGCYVTAEYPPGYEVIRIGFSNLSHKLYFDIGDPAWKNLLANRSYPLELQFGANSPWTGNATAVPLANEFLVLEMPIGNPAEFLQEFATSENLSITSQAGAIGNLSLSDSSQALATLWECQNEYFPAAPPTPTPIPTPTPTPPPAPTPAPSGPTY